MVKIAIEFPPDVHLWGPDATLTLAHGVEEIGFDQIDLFDHVTYAQPIPKRTEPREAVKHLLEPMVTLGAIAAVTRRVGLGTSVLILPQRQPALVAKQIATLDVLSGGRVRLGVGVGWQRSEYDSLGVPFHERGRRMDEGIRLLRQYWSEESVTFRGAYHEAEAMGIYPAPVQKGGPPIWIGGDSDAALRRVGRLGDGWMAMGNSDDLAATAAQSIAVIRAAAEEAGRDLGAIELQARVSDAHDLDRLGGRIATLRSLGFTWTTVNASMLEAAGARGVDAQLELLARIAERIRAESGVAAHVG